MVEANLQNLKSFPPPINVASDGEHLLITSWLGNTVQSWNPATHEVIETHTGFFRPISAMRFQKDLVVAELGSERGTGRVLRQSIEERRILADAAGQIGTPTGLAADEDDLWVADWRSGKVYQLTKAGTTLDKPMVIATGLSHPEGLTYDPGTREDQPGSLLVVESGAGRLCRIHLASGRVRPLAEGLELGHSSQMDSPRGWAFNGVAVGPSGSIYVTGDTSSVLHRFEAGDDGRGEPGGS